MLLESCEHHLDENRELFEGACLICDLFNVFSLEITSPKVASGLFFCVDDKPQVARVKRGDLHGIQRENIFNLKSRIDEIFI